MGERQTMATTIRAVMVAALLGGGCAPGAVGRNVKTAVAVIGDVVECAPEEYGAVSTAIAHGGSAWIDVVLDLLHCVPAVVRDLSRPTATADVSGAIAPPLSKGARRRLKVARAFSGLVDG